MRGLSNRMWFPRKEVNVDYTTLSDIELLRCIVGPRVAERIYKGALAPLFKSDKKPGGRDKLIAARELIRRMLAEEMRRDNVLTSPTAVRDYLRLLFRGREYESFAVLYLDSQNRLIASEDLFRGTLNQTSVYPREIVKRALAQNCAAVIFSHCHPSGVAEPSRADELLTSTLKAALALVDIRVLDHLVVAEHAVVSFAERGLI
jgi:DNA repair protein RadC